MTSLKIISCPGFFIFHDTPLPSSAVLLLRLLLLLPGASTAVAATVVAVAVEEGAFMVDCCLLFSY